MKREKKREGRRGRLRGNERGVIYMLYMLFLHVHVHACKKALFDERLYF